jgi:hypothetical protein
MAARRNAIPRESETMDTGSDGKGSRNAATMAEEKLGSLIDNTEQNIVKAADSAKQSVESFAKQQQRLSAEQIGGVARAVRRAAEEMQGSSPAIAGSVHRAASRLDAASSTLRDQSINELMEHFGDFARKQPVAVLGGGVLAGFALSRFLKASAHR